MRIALIALFGLLIVGCSTWTHPTKNAGDFEADRYECEKDSAAVADPMQGFYMRRRCMQVKGWKD